MKPTWNLFRVFDDQAVAVICQAYDEVRLTLPNIAPEAIATAVLEAAETGELQIDRVRAGAIEALSDAVH